ncbi:hypothetical protein IPL68_06260 [Candidatus Saccharibacteria bacterium]|nr:MAG: hypothetical protein IPL68_06260 [Candidatus Saccharibacteria bacterium]
MVAQDGLATLSAHELLGRMRKEQGMYDFKELDRQMKLIENAGGIVTLCLGVKQPRWPEYHWPTWAITLPDPEKTQALLDYVRATVAWYDEAELIDGYQLENEAVLRGFGEGIDINLRRLRKEYQLVADLTEKPHLHEYQ